MGTHFALIGIRRIFDAAHDLGFKRLAFLFQFFDAFRIYDLIPQQPLNVAGSSARMRGQGRADLV